MCRNIVPASLLVSLLGFVSAPAHAEWSVYKFLDFGVTTTDNLQLTTDEEELVASIRPSIELSFDGNRFDTEILGEVEAYSFNERGDNIVDPRLAVTTAGELLDNLLFVNASLEFGKVISGDDFFDLTENSDSQARLRFNPFLSRSFGRFANLFVGYGHQSLDNETDGTIDFQQDTLAFALNRDPSFGGFIWGVGGNFDRLNVNEESQEQTFDNSSIFGSLGYALGQTTFFEVIAGQETNDFTQINNDGDSSAFLEGRLRWTPSERTELVLGFSDRFFGEGPTVAFSHQVRNSILTASWTRGVSNADVNLDSVTPFSEPVDSQVPTDGNVINVGDNFTARRLFVDERFSVGYKLAGRRSDFIADAIFSDQQEISGEGTRRQFAGRIAFDRHLSSLTTIRLEYQHLADEDLGEDVDNENRLGVRLIYNFDRKERTSIINEGGDS